MRHKLEVERGEIAPHILLRRHQTTSPRLIAFVDQLFGLPGRVRSVLERHEAREIRDKLLPATRPLTVTPGRAHGPCTNTSAGREGTNHEIALEAGSRFLQIEHGASWKPGRDT